jgi:predicted CXXCH cytochrome family protein
LIDGGEKLTYPLREDISNRKKPNKSKTIKNVFSYYWGIWFITGVLSIYILVRIYSIVPLPHPVEEEWISEPVGITTPGTSDYVGSERCRDCHRKQYDTWKKTLHSKFMQLPNEYSVIGDFEVNNKLTFKITNKVPKLAKREVTTTMYKKNGKFYVNTIGNDFKYHNYEITNVIGLGRRQSYITTFPNGEMHVLPVEWNIEKETWVDSGGFRNNYPGDGEYWSDQASIWQFRCGGCHVTGIKINYDKAKDYFDTTWADLGVACEACHGPGRKHVDAASVYFEGEKDTIINPANLPWRLRAMICGQCHNWGASTIKVSPHKEGFPEKYNYPYGYLSGKPLYLYYTGMSVKKKKHHQQYNEWRESEHAKAGIMCTNCHEVHQKEDIKFSMTKLTPDSLCMDCHKTLKRRAAHRIHTFGSCVACHMPKTIGHEHSHTFRFISPELSIWAGGVDKQPNSCSGCHHHKDTPLEVLVGFLDAVKKEDMPRHFSVHGKRNSD